MITLLEPHHFLIFAVTLSVPNHKDCEAEALQDFRAVLFRDEVTQPDWVVHGGIF